MNQTERMTRMEESLREYARLLADKGYLDGVLAEGAARADAIARRTLAKVYKKIGFLQL